MTAKISGIAPRPPAIAAPGVAGDVARPSPDRLFASDRIPVDEVRRRLGLPRDGGAAVLAHAAALGIDLIVEADWAGQTTISPAQAGQLVSAHESRRAELAGAKRRGEQERLEAQTSREATIAAAMRSAYRSALDAGIRAGDRDAELRAWNAAQIAALETRADLAAAETGQPVERWWRG